MADGPRAPGGMPSKLYFFMVLMLITGAMNAVFLKYQHMIMAPQSAGAKPTHFDHPFVQASFMMIGEFGCLMVYFYNRTPEDVVSARKVPKWIFIIPCCFDWLATAFVCMSLGLMAVSVVQMCRGAVVIFTCLLSYFFLGRQQQTFHLVGVLCVIFGITLVSYSAFGGVTSNRDVVFGVSLCVFAQIFQAGMYVYEEKIMSQYTVQPLQVVGWEGAWGLGIATCVLSVLYPLGYADTPGAFYQIGSSRTLLISIVLSVVCVSFFNFSGATVTQQSSAVARSTIKISSTILIWLVELSMGWNKFSFMQLVGFMFVAFGTLLYNKIIEVPMFTPLSECKPLMNKQTA